MRNMNKNIVRYMTVGQPVVIGARPKEEKPKPSEEIKEEKVEKKPELEPELEPEPKSGLPQEILDKVFAEIEEIERKEKLTEKILQEAEDTKAQTELIKAAAEKEAHELKLQAAEIKKAAEQEAEEIKAQAAEIKNHAQELESKAEETLDAAQKESDKIVADTKLDAEKLLAKVQKEGYDTGYKEGKEKGIADGKAKIEKELDNTIKQTNKQAEKILQDAKEQTSEYFIRAENDIAQILMMAIEKILPQHFLDVPQVILPIVREAIEHVRDQKQIKVHVEPYSYDLVLMARSEFQSMLTDGTAIIEIISDEALKPGDCVIETPNGGVDARLSTQLGLMKSAIQSVMNK